jgi:hypothetical protein
MDERRSRLRLVGAFVFLATAFFAFGGIAQAGPYTIGARTLATGPSPFPPGCGGPGEAGPTSFNSEGTEIEPWAAVDPTDSSHIVALWQQDRWNDGASHGLVAGVSHDGGATWPTTSFPAFSRCAGAGPGDPGFFQRSSDPWLSFSPNGDLYGIAIAVDFSNSRNAVIVSKSTDGGASWHTPIRLRFDTNKANIFEGTNFNDKESVTADPGNSSYAYAVWDRLVFPSGHASAAAQENARAFRGPTWFARTTNGGTSWQQARPIFDPGEQAQTIANQIVVEPNGDLVDGFSLLKGPGNPSTRGAHVAVVRSDDKGQTWSKASIVANEPAVGTSDPEPRNCLPASIRSAPCGAVRTGSDVPDFAVDRTGGPHDGNVYAVWQEQQSSSSFGDDTIVLSRSTDGGQTWSNPVQVNDTPGNAYNTQAFTPSVDVKANGDVAVTYYDMRDDTQGDSTLDTDYWIAHSHDGGHTWGASQQLAGPFDMRSAPYAGGYFVGDYEGLDNTGSLFAPFWVEGNGTQAFDALDKTSGFFSTAG